MFDKKLKDFKKCIVLILKLQDYWGKGILKIWIKVEFVLKMKRRFFKMCSILSIFEDFKRIDDQFINNDDELVIVFMYFYDIGVILF